MSPFESDFEEQGYKFEIRDAEKGDSNVKIFDPEGNKVKEFKWPTYKVFNLGAHSKDIVDGLKRGSNDGLNLAGWSGF